MKTILQNKAPGSHMTLAAAALSILTLIVYTVICSATRFMSWEAFGCILAGVILTLVLIFAKQYRFAPALLMAADHLGFCSTCTISISLCPRSSQASNSPASRLSSSWT